MQVSMYLRSTKRKRKDGSSVEYFQLAHNYRHPETKKPVAQIIHNFGRTDELDREELVRLCRSIARVCNLEVRDILDDEAQEEKWPKNLKQYETRPLGTVWVIEQLWERLGIGPLLRRAQKESGCKVPYERALLAMTANRLCEPKSKLGVWDRWLPQVYLPSCQDFKLGQMYEAMDLLYLKSAEVEEAVFFKTADLLNLEVDLIFYDTTSVSFSIDYEDDDEDGEIGYRKRGWSKEKEWKPMVVVALAVTREGIPVRSWVFPGNTSDVTTVEKVKADLKGWKLGRCLFIADAGMNSEDNRQELAKACGKYLLAVRVGTIKEVKEVVLKRRGRFKKISENLQAKEVEVGDGARRRRYILCYNPKEAKRQQFHREQTIRDLQDILSSHVNWDSSSKWAMELLTSRRYGRYLSVNKKKGQVFIDKKKIKEQEKLDGKWVLITNDDTLSVEDAACGYKSLMIIEQCFRNLKKTHIKIEPMNHWLPRRIEAHVKICVLSLLIQRVAEQLCGKSWSYIRHHLQRLQATEFHSGKHLFFRRNEIPAETARILKKLDISTPKRVLSISKTT